MSADMSRNFKIGEDFNSTEVFGLTSTTAVATDELLETIREFQKLGTIGDAERLVISNRVALRLIEDGFLVKEHFENATEGVDINLLEFIDLPVIKIEEHEYPIRIMSESKVGSNYIALVDKEGTVLI